ncbi:hypothetical protein acsn021_11250 [Anaerocolumna cellulosilytica]|uniref:Uncharacterized protein n=1 Tax=Anaerocolumna cellulosilytica TaxID=433286 RepID=A0A6S6QV49_9FIRM|nr:hypothetical protein [Anaerocolumna cellulosilytica]MBB5194612.1 hypothetical protein [Anaerocolumna cellulosilytica]BCJ93556.1 hypothetical protein acsn021_11250 [Anaerocolumna cellulosilytica]
MILDFNTNDNKELLIKLLDMEEEDYTIVKNYLCEFGIISFFNKYKTLVLSDGVKEKLTALLNLIGYEGVER